MALDSSIAFELADLNRKLATARALLSYEQKCAETRLLEAAEKQRQLRVELLHLAPEYEASIEDVINQHDYIIKSDRVLTAMNKRLIWTNDSLERYKQRNTELEAKLQELLISDGSEKDIVEAELEALKSQHKDIEEKLKWTRNELDQQRKHSESAIEPAELLTAKDEVAVLQREIDTLKTRLQDQATESTANQTRETAKRKELEKELSRLRAEHESAKNEFTAQTTASSAEKEELEKQLSQLRTEMKSTHKEPSVNQPQEAKNDELEKQILHLHTEHKAAQKESKAEKKELEEQLSRLQTEHKIAQDQSTTLENNLANTENLLKTAQNKISRLQAAAPIPLSVVAEADLKADVAKEIAARKKLEKDFYKFVSDSDEKHALLKTKLDAARAKLKAVNAANAAAAAAANAAPAPLMTMDDLGHSAKRTRKEAPKTSEFSLTPFFKKTAVVTTDSPLTPSAVVVGEDATVAGDGTMIDRSMRAERSIRIPSAIESTQPTRLLLAGANRKRKIPAKAATPPPPAAIPEESSEEEAPRKPQPKKKRAKKAPEKAAPEPVHIFDTPVKEEPKSKPTKKNAAPTSIFDDVPPATKPAPKKRKRLIGSTQAFREDDGTGRLVLAGDSGEASGGSGLMLRPPVTGMFTKEISPPKKRPEVLKRFFAGGKKIQGRPGG